MEQTLMQYRIALHPNGAAWPDEQRWTAAGADLFGAHVHAFGSTPSAAVAKLLEVL